jgi:hypothetical protein
MLKRHKSGIYHIPVEIIQAGGKVLYSEIHKLIQSMKSTVFWDVIPGSLIEVHQCLGGAHCLHLQGQRVIQAITQ